MNALTSIALSGLQSAQWRVASAGHNIANALTPGFRRQLVQQQALDGGGVSTTIERSPVAGDALAEDLVALKAGEHLYKANLQVLRTQDRMLGTLLDVTA
ncbi:MAG TPA: flagellar basal body rod protein [Burkholderiaceae bacterium]|nr:flagellar basal body rod protein [Burkholderiaceae bacterium]